MKNIFACVIVSIFSILIYSCSKTSFITSKDALLSTSTDTLRFDTVFTATGSVTHMFKIFNQNEQKLNISSVKLMGGPSSYFKMNVDGSPGTTFNNIAVQPNDSLYVFVTVTVNPSAANLPFVIKDSVLVNYNGNDHFVQLEAYGQNANFIRSKRIVRDTSWNNNLPYVILGGVLVDSNVTLNINKGCRIYTHADAPIIINGTLKVNGEKYDSTRVVFRGDRLDPDYRDFPGSWPGIYFGSSSKNNVLGYAIIKNAYQGIILESPAANSSPKVALNECVIDNIYDAGVLSINSSLTARNCLISNCGNNISMVGGTYILNHCTVASYANAFLSHKNPVLFISNTVNGQSFPLTADIKNSIFWGEGGVVDDEIVIEKKGSIAPVITFSNIIYKNKNSLLPAPVNSFNLVSSTPLFDSIDAGKRYFDFHIQNSNSPAVNKGVATGVSIDLDGNARSLIYGLPDIGCYEKH